MPPEYNSNTLDPVVSEQQMQSMTQIDLTTTSPGIENRGYISTSCESLHESQTQNRVIVDNNNINSSANNANAGNQDRLSSVIIKQIKAWPARIKDCFNAKMQEARSKSENKTEFIWVVLSTFSAPILWLVCLTCTIIIPIILLLLGLIKLDKCPARPMLSTYIFFLGFVMSASNFVSFAVELDIPVLKNHVQLSLDTKHTILCIMNLLFNCVSVCLFLMAMVTVFEMSDFSIDLNDVTSRIPHRTSTPSSDLRIRELSDPYYCDSLLYQFTFWFVTIVLILIAAGALFALGAHIMTALAKRNQHNQQDNNNNSIRPNNNIAETSMSQHSTLQFQSCEIES